MAKSRQRWVAATSVARRSGTEDCSCEETVGLGVHLTASAVVYSSLLERRTDFRYELLLLAVMARSVGAEVQCDSQNKGTDSAVLGMQLFESIIHDCNVSSPHSLFSVTMI